jgi:DNA-binding response OmpR family regulator
MWVASAPLADASPPRDIANMVHPAVTSSQNLLKRISGVLAAQNRASEPPRLERIEHLGLTLDRVRHRVFVDGNPLHLTPTEFKLLWELASRPGFVLSRNELSQVCRGTMSTLHTRTVDAHIKAIRRKLAGYASFIETVHGVGYRFRESDAR